MSRYSSDSDSSSGGRRKKSKKNRRRSTSSSSSSGSKYSSRNSKSCRKYKKGRRSRSREKRLKSDRRSRDDDRSSRRRRSLSRLSHSSRETRRRRSRSRSSSRRFTHSKSNDSKKTREPRDDGSELLEKLNEAAVQAMAENSRNREAYALLSGVPTAPSDQQAAIDEINSASFTPKSFTSSATSSSEVPKKKDNSGNFLSNYMQTTAVLPREHQNSVLHPNLLLDDQEEKLNRWVKKIFQIRQKSIHGDPFCIT